MKKLSLISGLLFLPWLACAEDLDIGPAPTAANLNEVGMQRILEQLAEDAIDEMDGQTILANHAYGYCNYELENVSRAQQTTHHGKKCWVLVVDLHTTFAAHPNTTLKVRVFWQNGQRIGQYVAD